MDFSKVFTEKRLFMQFSIRGLSTAEEIPFEVTYKEAVLGRYFCDLLVEGAVVVELKAVNQLNSSHVGQLLNYHYCPVNFRTNSTGFQCELFQ